MDPANYTTIATTDIKTYFFGKVGFSKSKAQLYTDVTVKQLSGTNRDFVGAYKTMLKSGEVNRESY